MEMFGGICLWWSGGACELSALRRRDAGGQRPMIRGDAEIGCMGSAERAHTRKLEQRIREDLGFRYLAGGATPDHRR